MSDLPNRSAFEGLRRNGPDWSTNRFETDLVNTVDQGLRLVDDIAAPNVGLLIDTFHMNIEEKDLPAAIGRAAGRIVEFHACSNDRGRIISPGRRLLRRSKRPITTARS
jgi:sugar phosphate isomerase/epimerase